VAAVFLADSLMLFYIAWESVLVPMFLLIGGWGSAGARRASMKFLVYTFAGGAVLLVGVLFALITGGVDSIAALSAMGGAGEGGVVLFWLLALGFLVKVPAVPLHTWLPDAHTEAPTAGSIILAGVLLKMGGYGLIRVALPLAPAGYESAAPWLAALGIAGIVWGACTALVQTDLKRLVAYSSVAHMGFVLLAVAVGTPNALSAALITMLSHGFVAGMLFYLVGTLYGWTHSRELATFGGLGAIAPRWSVAFVFAALASAGLPGLSGFPGEFVTTLEAFGAYQWWVLIAAVGIVLAAAYNLRAVRLSVQGPTGQTLELPDLSRRESASLGLAALVVVVIGLAPWLVTGTAAAALEAVAVAVGRGA
jgi:NADH-quinone oxidoreductase subunit M